MITFIIYNSEDDEALEKTMQSIKDNLNYFAVFLAKNSPEIDKNVLTTVTKVSSMFAMVIKAGDTLEKYLPMDYGDVFIPSNLTKPDDALILDSVRGILIGFDIINTFEKESDELLDSDIFDNDENMAKWIQANFKLSRSDFIEINLKEE